jgi:hypothetical protein
MPRSVDEAILEPLGLDAAASKLVWCGGSGFASIFKLTSSKDGKDVNYFVKRGADPNAELMFRGEHAQFVRLGHRETDEAS